MGAGEGAHRRSLVLLRVAAMRTQHDTEISPVPDVHGLVALVVDAHVLEVLVSDWSCFRKIFSRHLPFHLLKVNSNRMKLAERVLSPSTIPTPLLEPCMALS